MDLVILSGECKETNIENIFPIAVDTETSKSNICLDHPALPCLEKARDTAVRVTAILANRCWKAWGLVFTNFLCSLPS